MRTLPALALFLLSLVLGPVREGGGLSQALADAGRALEAGDLVRMRAALDRVLERDPNSLAGWELVERWADKAGDRDERVYALHRLIALARTQKKDKTALAALRAKLLPLDPVAAQLDKLRTDYVEKLAKLAEGYEKARRPHSAIRTYKQALALDPDRADIQATIERLAASPDPSLAEDARPKDLLEGISAEWIAKHDEKHREWSDKAVLEKPNYVTQTDAGYEVLVRTAEAMEQMNAFYRIFFRYGAEGDKRNPSRIFVNIFKTRSEYTQDPNDWSGGHFTGDAVETYIGGGGFEEMTGTLFHEAAHQFVSLATNAAGWLNEGLASFFEGTRILSNGTVIMNLPATGRLYALIPRMRNGFMSDVRDGIDPRDVTKDPPKSPTFRIVLEDQYEWGPPWYAPTWGVVFFLYNYQDPADGRFVYRKAFWDFVDASGGLSGASAIGKFEELVLANPAPVTPGVQSTAVLPKTVDELNEVWKDYILRLGGQQSGSDKTPPAHLDWARNAIKRGALDDALEHFERALATTPRDAQLLTEFGEFLAGRKKEDRAAKLLALAASEVEHQQTVDQALLARIEHGLKKVDASYQRLADVRAALVKDARAVIDRYLAENLDLVAMDLASRLGSELDEPSLYDGYEQAVRKKGHSLAHWRLVYNEENLDGWNPGAVDAQFKPNGETLDVKFGEYEKGKNDYSMLTLDEITSGDYSLEAEVESEFERVTYAGLVFGRKAASECHVLVLYPPAPDKNGFVDLATFHGGEENTTLRRTPVEFPKAPEPRGAPAERTVTKTEPRVFFRLRIDVTGRLVDVYVNGGYMATQEFPSLDVLRGSFGLVTGRGQTRFRNVRFLSRHPRDPSAAIERNLTLETEQAGGEAVNGSWLGMAPPFPVAQKWYQNERKGWEEARGTPQLLVLWDTNQNDQIPIDGYIRSLFDKNQNIGLRIVNLLAFWDESKAEAYLQAHPFPDTVALDTPTQAEHNFGITFERYEVQRFQMPRFILLDIDGKVTWEGDPGFAKGATWNGEESLLDVPLRELAAKRRLPELIAWRKGWPAARAALARGDFAAAAPALKAAADFDAAFSGEVAEASTVLHTIEFAAAGLDDLATQLAADGREPALEALIAWAEQLGKPVKKSKAVTAALKNPSVAAWKRVPALLKPVVAKAGKDASAVEDVLGKVAALPGAFPALLAERGRAVAGDAGAFKGFVDAALALPGEWLAREHFGWKSWE